MAEDLMHLAIIESAKDHDSAAVFGLRLPNKLYSTNGMRKESAMDAN